MDAGRRRLYTGKLCAGTEAPFIVIGDGGSAAWKDMNVTFDNLIVQHRVPHGFHTSRQRRSRRARCAARVECGCSQMGCAANPMVFHRDLSGICFCLLYEFLHVGRKIMLHRENKARLSQKRDRATTAGSRPCVRNPAAGNGIFGSKKHGAKWAHSPPLQTQRPR